MNGDLLKFNSDTKKTKHPFISKVNARPIIKWAGGKRSVIPEISKRLPQDISNYWEPFAGGAAAFFAFEDRINKAVISDLNEELILTYNFLKSNPEKLIAALLDHAGEHKNENYYFKVRDRIEFTSAAVASRFIYLNRTCYNGLYRVNKSGKFNVPKGSYKNPLICDSENLISASSVLQKADMRSGYFDKVVNPGRGDFIYCDPPYDECFNSYQPGGFNKEDQGRLKVAVDKWVSEGANVMISNSDTSLIRSLYKDYKIHRIHAARNINCKPGGRKKVIEVLITTYEGQRE